MHFIAKLCDNLKERLIWITKEIYNCELVKLISIQINIVSCKFESCSQFTILVGCVIKVQDVHLRTNYSMLLV